MSGIAGGDAMRVRFGDFTLDTDRRQLLCGDVERHLTPKAFELLGMLIESRPNAVSKADLHERLWPSTFVSEGTLTSLIAEVRHALGETARRRKFVRTVHRFGYAFGASAIDLTGAAAEAAPVNCWLVWDSGQTILADGDHLLGRDRDVAVWLESPTVSRHHARIRVEGARVTLEDLGSKNGTYLRGERIVCAVGLIDGDKVRLGSVPLTVRVVKATRSTITQSRPSERPR